MSADRKTARVALAGLLDTITIFEAVYDHVALKFGGLSPIATVESGGSIAGAGNLTNDRTHALLVTFYWRWGEDTEDGFDDLSADVFDLLLANDTNAAWDNLSIDEDYSITDYGQDGDGNVYRYEQIRVLIW